jgi:hypothetical protein
MACRGPRRVRDARQHPAKELACPRWPARRFTSSRTSSPAIPARRSFRPPASCISIATFDPTAQGPLRGVRVLDFSRLVAGNMLSLQLADFGAEVALWQRALEALPRGQRDPGR